MKRPAAAPDTIADAEVEAPDRMADVARVDAALGRIRRSMARQSLGRRVLASLGAEADSGLLEVLHAIAAGRQRSGGSVAIGTVAASLGVDPSQASRLVGEAVRRGYVERVPAAEDGRRSALALSLRGDDLLARFEAEKLALLGRHFADWSAADLADFARLLTRFGTIVRPEDGG